MKSFYTNTALFLACLFVAAKVSLADSDDEDDSSKNSAVMVLTKDNFDDIISSKPNVLVEFYAPWCGHCKSLEPEYEKAAEELKDHDPEIVLAKVDATVESELASRFEVQGYPTLKFFKSGEESPYDGARSAADIVEFLKTRSDPDWKPPPSVVKVLTSENFTDFINNNELCLVEFYAPWCGHCKKLEPEYEKAAKVLADDENPVALAKVDATTENPLSAEYNVSGYPTLIMFRNGRQFEYKGDRTESGIIGHMRRERSDASREVKSTNELKKSVSSDDATVVGFFTDKSAELYQTYIDMSNENRNDFVFLHTFDSAAREQYKAEANSVVVLTGERFHTKYEPKLTHYKGSNDRAELYEFVVDSSVPLVGEYSSSTKQKRYADKRPLVLFTYMVDWSFEYRDTTQMWRRKIAEIANSERDLTFAVGNEESLEDVMKACGLDTSGEDMNVCIIDKDDLHYPLLPAMEEYEQDDVEEFIAKFKKGKLRHHIKSQPVPKGKQGAVKVVVGKTFQELVMNPKKDTLIEFYAPWCGHCKKLEPVYKKFAKKITKNEKNLIIAKIDATANDFPKEFEVSGYPTIYMVPAGAQPVRYEGANEPEKLTEFVKKHATASFKKEEL